MHGGYRIAVRSCCHQCAVDVGEEPALHKSLEAGRHQTSMLLNATGPGMTAQDARGLQLLRHAVMYVGGETEMGANRPRHWFRFSKT